MMSVICRIKHGMIVLWSGTFATIPAGWALCDGTHGTPNLADKFVSGAGVTTLPGVTGGAIAHEHTFTTDGHLHNIDLGASISEAVPKFYTNVTDYAQDTGTTELADNLPPFYALAYIMKL